MDIQAISAKSGSLYCACAPAWGLVCYGTCQDEALNNLQDEIELCQEHARKDDRA